jgi:5-methyltetrahydropteroyltriglutamate--homocysteine methyltransferase
MTGIMLNPRPGRILTTHAGSLPRPADLAEVLDAASRGQRPDPGRLAKLTALAVEDAVNRQEIAGVDVVSDGEMGSISFLDTAGRLTGYDGPMASYFPADLAGLMPSFAATFAQVGDHILPSNTSAQISYQPERATEAIFRFRQALAAHPLVGAAFLAAPSPGVIARLGSSAFASHEELVYAIAAALRQEYQLITSAGLQVQLDCPDLAMGKHTDYAGQSIEEFRAVIRLHVEALNWALAGIPAEQVRLHVCWGNYPGPHHYDVPLEHIIEVLYRANAGTLVLEHANPRHRHEWRVFRDHPLPDHMILAAGVVDTTSPHVEHPQAVADSLVRLAEVVGADRLIAATDCGFATFAAVPEAPAEVAYLKLAALAEGARLASDRLVFA